MTIPDRWNLLRVSPCRACGRPVAEGCACGWCGEQAPVAGPSLADIALVTVGLVLLGTIDDPSLGVDTDSVLAGWLVAEPLRETPDGRFRTLPAAALAAGAAALAAKLAPDGWPVPPWAFPATALAALLLVPAPLPPVPAATTLLRLLQRFNLPRLSGAALMAAFVWAFATYGTTPFALLGLAFCLCALGRRMRRPAALLVPAALCLAPDASNPGAFALGIAATGLVSLLWSTRSP